MKKNINIYTLTGMVCIVALLVIQVWVGPNQMRLPNDFSYSATIHSQDNFYNKEQELFLGVQNSQSEFLYTTKETKEKALILEGFFDVRKKNGDLIFSTNREYAIDPYTGKHVSVSGVDTRGGYLFAPRFNQKKDFTYWHINYNVPIEMRFQEVEFIEGLKTHHFEAQFIVDQTDELLHLSGVPEQKNMVTEVTLSLWIEPFSGYLVSYEDSALVSYVDAQTKELINPWNKFSNTYTNLSKSFHVVNALTYKTKTLIWGLILPLLLLCIFIFIVFLVLYKKKVKHIKKQKQKQIHPIIIPFVIFIVLIFLTIVAWDITRRQYHKDVQNFFRDEINLVESALKTRTHTYETILQAGRGLFLSSDIVTRDEWKLFSESLILDENFPGMQGYGYSVYIPAEEKAGHIAEIRSQGFPDYTIYPEGERNEYTSIIYLEPFDARNQKAFGLDMFFEKNRKAAMSLARDINEPTMSGRVILVQEIDENVQAGFLMYTPLYDKSLDIETILDRQKALQGYVYAPFRMNDFMSSLLGDHELTIDFEIYDGVNDISEETLMYKTNTSNYSFDKHSPLSRLTETRVISVANHEWTIVFKPRPEFGIGLAKQGYANIILFFGFFLSISLFYIFYLMSIARINADKKVRQVTSALRKKIQENEMITDETKKVNIALKNQSKELKKKISEVEQMNKHLVGREVKMMELKKQINKTDIYGKEE